MKCTYQQVNHPLQVKLDLTNEFLTSIHGHYGCLHDRGAVVVRSLTFESNKRPYGPFGTEQGTPFSFPMAGGKIVGFHGRSGWLLDAIGVYLKSSQKLNRTTALVQPQNYVASGTEQTVAGYSIIQGSIGQNFDIVLAVKQRGDHFNAAGIGSGTGIGTGTQTKLLKETNGSHELVAVEKTREKVSLFLFWIVLGYNGCLHQDNESAMCQKFCFFTSETLKNR